MKPTLSQIFDATLVSCNIDPYDYSRLSSNRDESIVDVRRLTSYIAFERGYTFSAIGRFLKKNHTTVRHYCLQMTDFIKLYDNYASKYAKIVSLLAEIENTPKEQKTAIIKGYVARDSYDELLSFFVNEKPSDLGGIWITEGLVYQLPKELFPQLEGDSTPLECELILRIKQHE